MVDLPKKGLGFPRIKRLQKASVLTILSRGRSIRSKSFDMQFVGTELVPDIGARIAVAAPKKLLPTAVARNRIKRIAREVFRNSEAGCMKYDVLLKYRLKDDCRTSSARTRIRTELAQLFGKLPARSGQA